MIVGSGIAGVAAAYHLSALAGSRRVTIIDPLAPLSLTTAMGTEAYRNWWPDGPTGMDPERAFMRSRS